MKLLKAALLALTLLAFTLTAHIGPRQAASETTSVALAMEPASWVFVAFGLVGGGFLRRRRLPGLNLAGTNADLERSKANIMLAPTASLSRNPATPQLPKHRTAARRLRNLRAIASPPRKVCATAAATLVLLLTVPTAFADSFTFSSQAVPVFALSPSADTLSLNSQTGTASTSPTPFVFQTGDFVVGNSQIPDQVIPFSFQDTITLNGITETLTLNGQDVVTQAADTLTIFGSGPLSFGNETFTVQSFNLTETDMGDFPVALSATVTPEPTSLLLLGTGIIAGALFLARKNHAPRA